MIKILIIGLSGSGKTTLAKLLAKKLNAKRLNGDKVRKKFNDWDFSIIGILRQSKRIEKESKKYKKSNFVIADFICPFKRGREIFNPDILIWMDTVKKGRFKKNSIDHLFEKPKKYDFRIKTKSANKWSIKIYQKIKTMFKIEQTF